MDSEAQIILDDTISFCERDGRDARLVNILAQCVATELTDTSITLEAPTRFACSYLEKQRPILEPYFEEITFAPLALTVAVSEAMARPRMASSTADAAAPSKEIPAHKPVTHQEAVSRETPDREQKAEATIAPPTAPRPIVEPPHLDLSGTGSGSGGAGKVKITNVLSPEDFKQLTSNAKAASTNAGGSSGGARQSQEDNGESQPQAVPISSKFTFENFVYGDENKHAYQSAVRFAAMADEPGTCTSLFIYGKSGLGKTHLLLAIKNYLNENNPRLRVKYANSQTYVENYIREVAESKSHAGLILREYHDADVLIIDDIQNIVGKTQSIENFFALVDEFIRNNKKIAIASDRAPKSLGMDERLTSRFNAGMLCLVSEPGFEMKYNILKQYYENTILPDTSLEAMSSALGGTGSLLDALRSGYGTLSDEMLRHMADVSGTNIRELESFCERCAGTAYEREQLGAELTGRDIDEIAGEYFDSAHKRIYVETVQKVVEDFYHVSHQDLIGERRTKDLAFARHVAIYLTHDMCEMTTPMVGAAFGGRNHSTVQNSIKVVERRMKEDRAICEDLQTIRNKIVLMS